MAYHPSTRLRHDHSQISYRYDLGFQVAVNADVPDHPGQRVSHTQRIGPRHWAWPVLARLHRELVEAHYAALGLDPPAHHELHPALHPAGYPPATPPHVADADLGDGLDDAQIAALTAHTVTAKEAEMGVALPPELHPQEAPDGERRQ